MLKNGVYGALDCLTKRNISEKAFNVKRDQKLVLELITSEFIHKRERVVRGMFARDTRTQNGSQILRQIVVISTNGGENRSMYSLRSMITTPFFFDWK